MVCNVGGVRCGVPGVWSVMWVGLGVESLVYGL